MIWKTIGQHQVSVTVTDNIAGCTDTFSINITVTGCIENIQAIQPKYHKEDYEYILILVYPNVDNEGDGSHNGQNYIAYTFYLENEGPESSETPVEEPAAETPEDSYLPSFDELNVQDGTDNSQF